MNNNIITENLLRHDRIDRVTGVTPQYKNAIVCLEISQEKINTYNGQVMTIIAANLISRWAKGIALSTSNDVDCVLTKYQGRKLISVLTEIIQIGNCDCELSINANVHCDFSLVIGVADVPGSIWIDCDGWLAGYGFDTPSSAIKDDTKCVLGATLAACLGVSEIFRQAIGEKPNGFQKWFSLFDYTSGPTPLNLPNPAIPESIDFGMLHQIGCGAIGSSFDFILSLTEDITGTIHLIDHDHIEETNIPASLIFSQSDVIDKNKKVIACANEFKKGINVVPFQDDYAAFIKANLYRINAPDLILCFANDRNIWSTIQHKCPPITFHATTNKTWGTNFGRHIPEKDWCIMCRFHTEIKQIIPLACSTGNISNTTGEEKLGILPFLASTSALITLSELYKLHIEKVYPDAPSFVEFSMRKPTGQFMAYSRPPKDCEVCKGQSPEIYPSYIKGTKYWYLST